MSSGRVKTDGIEGKGLEFQSETTSRLPRGTIRSYEGKRQCVYKRDCIRDVRIEMELQAKILLGLVVFSVNRNFLQSPTFNSGTVVTSSPMSLQFQNYSHEPLPIPSVKK